MIHDMMKPPTTGEILPICRWLLRVLDDEGKTLAFVASVTSQYLQRGALSQKQADALARVFTRTLAMFESNALDWQEVAYDPDEANVIRLDLKR